MLANNIYTDTSTNLLTAITTGKWPMGQGFIFYLADAIKKITYTELIKTEEENK